MHALVIGAGPAGSLAAILLARHGVDVTLIEQHGFPRDKVCGECLSALGREVLRRNALERRLTAIGVELTRTRLITPDHAATLDLPSPMLGITRSAMDALLLHEAVAAGAKLLQPARAEKIDGRRVRVRSLPDNVLREIDADWIVLADGRGALLGERPALTGDLGIKAHFADIALDAHAITLFSGHACYGGVAPVEGDRWNVAFSVPADWVREAAGDVGAVFARVTEAHPQMAEAFRSAQRLGAWLASPLPRYDVRDDWPAGVVPVGNAACAIEPIGGEGMGAALRSAELAVDAILNDRVDRLPDAYRSLWRSRSWFCRAGAMAFSRESWASACVALAESPAVARLGLALIGK